MAPAEDVVEVHKQRGNELLKSGQAAEAAEAYAHAITTAMASGDVADSAIAAIWSNRSAANLQAGNKEEALKDAKEAARMAPTWAKSHLRTARALEALGWHREAAAAAGQGVEVAVGEATERRVLQKLQAELLTAAVVSALQGWWHGTVSKVMGEYQQELCFSPGGVLVCAVYGQELTGTYEVKDVEISAAGVFHGGINVVIEQQRVPYLFRTGETDGLLHMCCPMTAANERPRTFDGPGYMGMRAGRDVTDELAGLTEGQKIVRYLTELTDLLDSQASESSGGAEATERLDEAEKTTLHMGQVMGPQSLEDKAQKLGADQRMDALRVKYAGGVAEAATRLIKGEVAVAEAYPAEAKELERCLRSFAKREDEKDEAQREEATVEEVAEREAPSSPAAATAKEPSEAAPAKVHETVLAGAEGS